MLGERDDAEARCDVPHFDLPVISSSDDALAVGGVGDGVDGIEVALLLEDVGFGLPFPDEELAEFGGAEGEPFAAAVDGDEIDFVLGDAEWWLVFKITEE